MPKVFSSVELSTEIQASKLYPAAIFVQERCASERNWMKLISPGLPLWVLIAFLDSAFAEAAEGMNRGVSQIALIVR